MEISIFLEPPIPSIKELAASSPDDTIGKKIKFIDRESTEDDLKGIDIAIIGVKEERGALNNKGCSEGPDKVRKKLYALFANSFSPQIADFGNIGAGNSLKDTYFAVSTVVTDLLKKKIVTIVLGGSQDITYAVYRAYEILERTVNIAAVDSRFDIGEFQSEINSRTYLNNVILHQPNYLFNYSHLGYQTYFGDQKTLDLMEKLFFDTYRLGQVRANMEEVEPIVRNADILTFDLGAIRYSDAPGNRNASPNGFYGEEACQITRYAGLSDKLTSIGFYELNPLSDKDEQTAHLVAQMIWYFLEGYYNRKQDYPVGDKSSYLKYNVGLEDGKYNLVFYKSDRSGRWWMEVPYPPSQRSKYERHYLVPCSYNDYQTACDNEMPDRWWQAFQKLS